MQRKGRRRIISATRNPYRFREAEMADEGPSPAAKPLAERLRLQRPLVFLDVESTGVSVSSDRIIEIAALRINPDGSEEYRCKRVNPGIPIPADATAVHGITDADVANEPPFTAYAQTLWQLLSECDFAGFGVSRFDLPLLEAEFGRAGLQFAWRERRVIDAMAIFHNKERRDLPAAVLFYLGREFASAHAAGQDVGAALEVLYAQLQRYEDLPSGLDELHSYCNPTNPDWIDPDGKFIWSNGVPTIAFGKHMGTPLAGLVANEPDYLAWVLKGDFSPEVKQLVKNALDGAYPKPPDAT
jgi:DNA polymerase-3 subunit epsilon